MSGYMDKMKNDIKRLILGKNKPRTEIQTPTRKVYFYRFVRPSTHPKCWDGL